MVKFTLGTNKKSRLLWIACLISQVFWILLFEMRVSVVASYALRKNITLISNESRSPCANARKRNNFLSLVSRPSTFLARNRMVVGFFSAVGEADLEFSTNYIGTRGFLLSSDESNDFCNFWRFHYSHLK